METSTIAKELQRKFGRNTMLISQDVIRRDMLRVKDGENTPALPLMKEFLIYGSNHSEIVILEGIMYADWYKTLFELAIQLYDTRVYKTNDDSRRTIVRNGGKLENEVKDEVGLSECGIIQRYWIIL